MKEKILNWYQARPRRVWAGIFLGTAAVMTVIGAYWARAVIESSGKSMLLWWGSVFLMLLVAFALAMLDLIYLRRDMVEEKRELARKYLFDKKLIEELRRKTSESQSSGEKSPRDSQDNEGGRAGGS